MTQSRLEHGKALDRGRDRSFMTLALAVWIGTLPFVFLLVIPLHGVRAAVTAAVVMLVGLVIVCWAVCAWQPPDE